MGLTDANENITLTNKIMGTSWGKNQATLPNKVEIFKGLSRNKVNTANIEGDRTKRNHKGKSWDSPPAG